MLYIWLRDILKKGIQPCFENDIWMFISATQILLVFKINIFRDCDALAGKIPERS